MTVCVHAARISAPRGEGNEEEHESALWACGAHRQDCGLARRAASHAHDAHTVYTSKKLVRNLGPSSVLLRREAGPVCAPCALFAERAAFVVQASLR